MAPAGPCLLTALLPQLAPWGPTAGAPPLGVTDALLLNKFFGYGQEVFRYIWSEKTIDPVSGRYHGTHDPMCELFPTEVSVNWR